jgi:hypothetical protein
MPMILKKEAPGADRRHILVIHIDLDLVGRQFAEDAEEAAGGQRRAAGAGDLGLHGGADRDFQIGGGQPERSFSAFRYTL